VTDAYGYDPDRPDVWTWLQAWYVARCNNEWEHGYGIAITTIDNPGWSVAIDLNDTDLDRGSYTRRETHRSEDDWCVTWIEEGAFRGACGPTNLAEALHEFRLWAIKQAAGGDLAQPDESYGLGREAVDGPTVTPNARPDPTRLGRLRRWQVGRSRRS